jgi:AraC-like DNA-binding protein
MLTVHNTDRLHSYLYLWPGRLLVASPGLQNPPHSHLAASVLIALEKPFTLGIAKHEPQQLAAALVAPDIQQHLDSHGRPMVVLHVDPDLPHYRNLASRLGGRPMQALPASSFDGLRDSLHTALSRRMSCNEASALFDSVLACIRGDASEGKPLDARVARIVNYLRRELPEKIDPAALAAEAGLSKSRLMHLFKDELGTSMCRFALCLRLQEAARQYRSGMSMTAVAHNAGFYDLSHMVQAGRAYVGYGPSALQSMFNDGGQLHVYSCADCHPATDAGTPVPTVTAIKL